MKFYQQELSWLAFNERVLQEAADTSVPVIERMRFLGIFSNNMDEFFQVRVADVRRAIYFAPSAEEREQASQLLTRIQHKVMTLQEQFERIYTQVLDALAENQVHIVDDSQLNDSQRLWLTAYFHANIKRDIVPLLLNERSDLVQILKQDRIYLFVEISHQQQLSYAAIEVPTDHLHRFVELPKIRGSKAVSVILLDHIVATRRTLEPVASELRKFVQDQVIGTSGTIRAIAQWAGSKPGQTPHQISRDGLRACVEELLSHSQLQGMQLAGVDSERMTVIPGGLAILLGLMEELDINRLEATIAELGGATS